MFRAISVGLLVGVIGGAACGAPPLVVDSAKKPVGKPHAWHHGGGQLRQLIQGEIARLMVLRSDLNLTAEQKAKIVKILKERKGELVKVLKGVWDKRNVLRDNVLAGADEKDIRKAADDLGKAIGDAAVVFSKVAKDVKPVLTDEQRNLIKKTKADSDAAVERFFQQAAKTGS